jgi:hypothetical protein
MTTQSVHGRSLESTEAWPFSTAAVETLSPKSTFGGSSPWELIDSAELARRWNLPASWIRSHCRKRTFDEILCLRLGCTSGFAGEALNSKHGSPAIRRRDDDCKFAGG